MLRFLFMGDRHNSETIPYSRTDDYQASCEMKDNEIIDIAKRYKVDAILHPGDFWTDADRRIGNEYIAKIALRWMAIGIPLIGISGNHDLIGNNKDSLINTTTGLLDSLGVFKVVKDDEVLKFSDNKITVALTGTNYHKGMDRPEFLNDYIVEEKVGDYHIHLVHGMLSPTSLGKIIRHTTIDQIKDTAADITLCGHDHIGFGIINYNNKYFVNPGAVVRMTCDRREIDRKISVVLIEIDQDRGIRMEQIHLKSAKPGEEVISREHIEEKLAKSSYEEFVKDGVAKLKIGNGISITDVLEEIYERDAIPDPIKQSISKQILEKTESLKQKAINAPDGTEIAHISIHNFQSHADTDLDLDSRFNVIVGESHQGKSAILRAIRWVAENKPTGKGVIRIGSTEASVELTLRNGTIIRRFISVKENGYKVFKNDGSVLEGNTHMVETIQELMGWNSMPIGEGDKIPLNHLKQGDSWYLIGDRYTSSDRARILGSINNTDGADAAIKEFDKLNSRIGDAIKYEEVEVINLTEEIKTAEEQKQKLSSLKETIQKALLAEKIRQYLNLRDELDRKTGILQAIENRFDETHTKALIGSVTETLVLMESIEQLVEKHGAETKKLQAAADALTKLSSVDDTQRKIATVADQLLKYEQIETRINIYAKANWQKSENESIIVKVDRVADLNIGSICDQIKRYEQIQRYADLYRKAERSIFTADELISKSKNIDRYPDHKRSILDHLNRIESIGALMRNRSVHLNQIEIRSMVVESAEQDYADKIDQKVEILRSAHICPTCYSAIDDQIIAEIAEKAKV